MQIQFIRSEEIKKYLSKGAQFIDLRDREDYEKKHIKNAISIPYEQLEQELYRLQKNRTYVLYCERGSTSMLAAKKMMQKGYQVLSLSGGMNHIMEKD